MQLNAFTAEGIAINKVVNVNTEPKKGLIPEINIWCAHTINDKNAIPKIEPTKIGLRELVEIISEVIPNAGKITI